MRVGNHANLVVKLRRLGDLKRHHRGQPHRLVQPQERQIKAGGVKVGRAGIDIFGMRGGKADLSVGRRAPVAQADVEL